MLGGLLQTKTRAVATTTPEDMATVLGNERRRLVLRLVGDCGELPVDELSRHVAGAQNCKPVDAVTADERKRVYIALVQTHLETLEDSGLVVYDDRMKAVAPTDSTAAAVHLIEELHEVTGVDR